MSLLLALTAVAPPTPPDTPTAHGHLRGLFRIADPDLLNDDDEALVLLLTA